MAVEKYSGRQFPISVYMEIPASDLVSGDNILAEIPAGAYVIDGSYQSTMGGGVIALALKLKDLNGTTVMSDVVDIATQSGSLETTANLVVTVTGRSTTGSLCVALTYVVKDRTNITQG